MTIAHHFAVNGLAASGMCAFWREGGGASLPRTLRPRPCWQTLLFGRDVHAP